MMRLWVSQRCLLRIARWRACIFQGTEMPSYAFLDSLETYLQTRKFPVNTSKNLKKLINNTSKHFIYKDGCLLRSYRGRLLRVVRSDEEVRDVLIQYHDNNNHAGWGRAVKEILLMFYWVGVTKAVKKWIKACAVCQKQAPTKPSEPRVQFCLVYGCDASSYIHPDLSFHRFPKKAEQRQKWLAVAQRDEGSLRSSSYICSRHFDPSCFTLNEDGQLTLSSDAVPTIVPDRAQEDEVPIPSDEEAPPDTLEALLSAAASTETEEPSHPATDQSETYMELQEHQYCSSAPDSTSVQAVKEPTRRKTAIEATFVIYNQITRYLSHRILPMQSKKSKSALRRMSKRFALIDGVLMYTRVSPPVRVPRSREEVNSVLREFHDNKGHYGQGICQREIAKHFYWTSMTRDLTNWINNCQTCLNRTKRKWMRCSVLACTNCCGPVERRLGLTFHKFPLHNATLFAQWLKATGRLNWHPQLRSSICSIHFTEDCFDRSGEVITLNPNAVPTLMVHSDSAEPSRGPIQPALGKAIFAKYDAVELYLTKRTYPPGLNYVEKNTFRRFCKKFSIKEGVLHMGKGDGMRLVLRNRQQVETALLDYHNELNHLDVNKCLRLLNERYFWKTMRPDVVQWINNCSQCSVKRRKNPNSQAEARGSAAQLQELTFHDLDGVNDGDTDSCSANGDEGRGSDSGTEGQLNSKDTVDEPSSPLSSQTVIPNNPQPRVPILLHLKSPINLQPGSPNIPFATKLLPVTRVTPSHFQGRKDPKSSEEQTCIQIQINPQPKKPTQPQEQTKTSSPQSNTNTQHCIQAQVVSDQRALPKYVRSPSQNPAPEANTSTQIQSQRPLKKTRGREANHSVKTSSSCGMEPVKALSTKPWPVFTISNSALEQAAKPPPEGNSSAVFHRSIRLQARTVIQQCSHAKVKIKPALDGADAQWVEIQQGLVVYVCFFHGATEEVTHDMASKLMTTRLFRKNAGHSVSLLDLPGSILFVPQDSLLGKTAPHRRMQYVGGCELWWGAQLFSNLVSACRELMSGSAKCTSAGVKVEHGLYGQKQEISLTSVEPLTVLLEF